MTITSGFAGYDLLWFTLLSVITRGARFGVLAALIGRYGPAIRGLLDRHLGLVVGLLAVVVVGGFAMLKLLY